MRCLATGRGITEHTLTYCGGNLMLFHLASYRPKRKERRFTLLTDSTDFNKKRIFIHDYYYIKRAKETKCSIPGNLTGKQNTGTNIQINNLGAKESGERTRERKYQNPASLKYFNGMSARGLWLCSVITLILSRRYNTDSYFKYRHPN